MFSVFLGQHTWDFSMRSTMDILSHCLAAQSNRPSPVGASQLPVVIFLKSETILWLHHSLMRPFTHETIIHSWDHSLMRPFSDSSFTDESLSGTQHSPLNQANMEDWCGPQAPSMRSEQMNQCLGPLFPQESLWLTSLLHLQHATQMGLRAQVDDWVFMLALPWPVNGYEKDVLSWDFPSDIVCIWFGKVNIVKKKKERAIICWVWPIGFLPSSVSSFSQLVVRVAYSGGKELIVRKVLVHTQRQGSCPLPKWWSWGSAMWH
jgi:hypothetical protein